MESDERLFVFRLATLRRMRENDRDECRQALATAQREDDALLASQAELERQRGEMFEQTRDAASPGVIDVERLAASRDYGRTIAARQGELDGRRHELSNEIERRREAALAAQRLARTLEKLEERHRQRHREEEKRFAARRLEEAIASVAAVPPAAS